MKTPLAAFLITASTLCAQETTSKSVPITGDDIAQILELSAHKETISFGKLKHITFRVESMGQKWDFPLTEPTSNLTLLTYVPAEGGEKKPFLFWLIPEKGAAFHSKVFIDTSKRNFENVGVIDGIYTIIASETKDMKAPTYRMQVLASDEKP